MSRILLFADDGSPGADQAWAWVAAQHWHEWRVTVLTVEPVGVSHADPQAARSWVPRVERVLPESAGARTIESLIADGDPREVLSNVAADLLVIGRRGAGLLKRLHIGSVAEALLDNPSAPLLIAHGGNPVQHITLAVDGSRYAARATEVLADMPWLAGARVTVLGVDEGDGHAHTAVETATGQLVDHAVAIDRRVIDHDPDALTVNVRYALDHYIAEHPCDLVVCGTKGLTGSERLRLGSVADYIAHHVDASVLLVRDAYRR
jgi:nucleotide-binding universal stress UspA family protein